MSNIVVRTITGAVFITVILFPLFWMKEATAVVLALFMYMAVIEFYQLFTRNEGSGLSWELSSTFALVVFSVITGIIFDVLPDITRLLLVPLIFVFFLIEFWRNKGKPVKNIAVSLMGIIYVVIPFLLMIDFHAADYSKFPELAGMFILIWINDTFAYLFGSYMGKHKLIERISPNKTWEGTIGGIIFTVIGGLLVGFIFDEQRIIFWTLSSMVIAPIAVLGDLIESMIKRSQNVKDSGKLLPGHGGILDRFDAAIFTIPFFVAWSYCYSYICL